MATDLGQAWVNLRAEIALLDQDGQVAALREIESKARELRKRVQAQVSARTVLDLDTLYSRAIAVLAADGITTQKATAQQVFAAVLSALNAQGIESK